MDYDTPGARERLAGFWGTDRLPEAPGLKAVDLFEAVHRGDFKVLWIMGTNPAVSLPDSARVCEALAGCPTVIVSDCMANTDTTAFADILLPAAGWGEKDGTVTNSERCISRQRSFLPLPTEVWPDWRILTSVARELGYARAFPYQSPADIFREHAALSALACKASDGRQVFDIGALGQLTEAGYNKLEPIQWPVTVDETGVVTGTPRLFCEGRFATDDGRAWLVPIHAGLPRQTVTHRYPLVVNTGRIRDQWHTMTRTALASRLLTHRQEPFVEIHPDDALRFDVCEGALCQLTGPGPEPFIGRARVTSDQRPGEVFIPIHWSGRFASQSVATNLIASVADPISGQPESKHGVASLRRLACRWQARLMRRSPGGELRALAGLCDYWCHQPLGHSDSWWLAGSQTMDWESEASTWLAGEPQLIMADSAQGRFRAARVVDGRLDAVLLVDSDVDLLPDLAWLDQCFAADRLSPDQRLCLLAGRSVETEEIGALVCSCFQVGDRQILNAIRGGQLTVEALGQALKCGTNCGSCVPEIRELLQDELIETG
jgi:assimilatory nitrate reductase catalytic subunit